MTHAQAIKLAIKALRRRAQELAPNANLWELYDMNNSTGCNASQERRRLLEAARILEGEL
jgi:enhancing lycopene biosynthesis protein 2